MKITEATREQSCAVAGGELGRGDADESPVSVIQGESWPLHIKNREDRIKKVKVLTK